MANDPSSPSASVRPLDPAKLLAARFVAAIRAAYPALAATGVQLDASIAASKNPKFGEFQCNAAMNLAKLVAQPPRDVAKALVANVNLDGLAQPLTDLSIAGPGFINLTLLPDTLARLLGELDSNSLGLHNVGAGHTVVVDLCGVNLAKQMHVGHIRATFLGDTVARVFERLGYTTIRQNHVGDWGLNIAMVTTRLAELQAAGQNIDTLDLDAIERLYKAAQHECGADEKGLAAVQRFNLGPKAEAELSAQVFGAREAMARAKHTLVKLQAHDPKIFALWQRIADVTMRECLAICKRMAVNVTSEHSAGESTYAQELGPMVDDLVKRRIAEVDDGALVIRVEGVEEPCLIRKSDGGYLYATTDIAAIRRRVQTFNASRVIYCVDARQSLHFNQVFGAAAQTGYTTIASSGTPARLDHAAFGTILGEDGRPFKTRSGESVKLSDLVTEAIDRADKAIDARERSDESQPFTAHERREIAAAVGIAALKYTDLSSDRIKDYVFSFDRMLAFEGNTGPYLLYALVRTRNVLRKASERGISPAMISAASIEIAEPEEKALALTLLRYPSVVEAVADALEPHRLCQFMYDLAGAYSTFYAACHVLNAESEPKRLSRLRLCHLCERILDDGLSILGIQTLQRM